MRFVNPTHPWHVAKNIAIHLGLYSPYLVESRSENARFNVAILQDLVAIVAHPRDYRIQEKQTCTTI